MKTKIKGNPDFGHLDVQLDPNEVFLVESGAMAYMDSGMQVDARFMGGFLSAIFRRLVANESLLVGEYSSPSGGSLTISPAVPGTVVHTQVQRGETIFFQGGAFLAGSPTLDITTQFGGCKSFFSGEGAFFLKVEGHGDLFFNAYGGVIEKEINGRYTVDTGHLVGWESSLEWTIGKMGSLKTAFLSGEGLVMNFEGTGKVWLQTRSLGGIAGWLSKYC